MSEACMFLCLYSRFSDLHFTCRLGSEERQDLSDKKLRVRLHNSILIFSMWRLYMYWVFLSTVVQFYRKCLSHSFCWEFCIILSTYDPCCTGTTRHPFI